MDKTLKSVLGVALVAVVAIGCLLFFVKPHIAFGIASTPGVSGTPTTLSGGSVPTLVSALEASESFISDGPLYRLAALFSGSSVTGTLFRQDTSNGACASATTTLFAIAPPSGATSTAELQIFNVGGFASSTQIQVGTSTTNTGLVSTSISASLVNTTIATSTIGIISGGVTAAGGGGNGSSINAGTGTTFRIIVPANTYLSAWASTSPSSLSGNANGFTGYSTCNYKITWGS